MSDRANNSSISCSCGKCELVLNERRAKFAILCACEDCRQALSWGASKGGDKPELILFACYMRSDIAPVPSEEIPVFHTFVYPQERARYRSIPLVANTMAPPTSPAKGQTLRQLIDSFGEVEILGLDRGQAV